MAEDTAREIGRDSMAEDTTREIGRDTTADNTRREIERDTIAEDTAREIGGDAMAEDTRTETGRHTTAEGNSVDIRFMFVNGSVIGPIKYSLDTTVQAIKEDLIAQWPRQNGPKSIYQVRIIHMGRTLDNRKTLADSRVKSLLPGGAITMHVVRQPYRQDEPDLMDLCKCCSIL